MHIDTEPQGNRHDEDAIGFENGRLPSISCGPNISGRSREQWRGPERASNARATGVSPW